MVVYFPKFDPDYEGQKEALLIKARVSTLAISGLTPDQANALSRSRGETEAPATGNPLDPGGGR